MTVRMEAALMRFQRASALGRCGGVERVQYSIL